MTKLETAVKLETAAQALAQERKLWQRDRETRATATEKEQS